MHHAFAQGNKMPLSGFTVQWPLIQTVADKALTFVNYHHLYYHCYLYRNHQHHYITTTILNIITNRDIIFTIVINTDTIIQPAR